MGEILQHLRILGFTELEAKCLHMLAESGTHTGYEIAKRLGVSRSNVYAALQKLAEKGVVLTSHGEPTHYQSLSIEDISRKIETDLQASIRYVKAHMPKQDAHRTGYFSLDGDAKVTDRLRDELKNAREEVLGDLARNEVDLLKADLESAAGEGVRILLATADEADVEPSIRQFQHLRERTEQPQSGRKFTLLIDRKLAIVGTLGCESAKVMLTEHPAMVELLQEHFQHAVVLSELHRDMGAKLEDKYGKNYKKIIQKYIDGKPAEGNGKLVEGKRRKKK
ncbi:TrmB family transcriptional regulator [Paenibacillus aestuarii]|uniref:TrmB family transcriptional regulator n=1 Tax=Paenibacillus aestuarii TaxID=516965 RepID=A0ABW0K0M2_9BACL|nr:helix-turn-helix domain-containing protein [Paenibacillus aestuarii]